MTTESSIFNKITPNRHCHFSSPVKSSPSSVWRVAPAMTVLLSPEESAEETIVSEHQLAEEREIVSYQRHISTTRGYYEDVVGPVALPIDMSIIVSPEKQKQCRKAEAEKTIRERLLPAAKDQYGKAAEQHQMDRVRAGDDALNNKRKGAARTSLGASSGPPETLVTKVYASAAPLIRVRTPVPTTASTKATRLTISDKRRAEAERSQWYDEPRVGEMISASKQRKAAALSAMRRKPSAQHAGGDNDNDHAPRAALLRAETTASVLKATCRASTPPPSSLCPQGRTKSPTAGARVLTARHTPGEEMVNLEPCRTFNFSFE